jgi:hypothetical protein
MNLFKDITLSKKTLLILVILAGISSLFFTTCKTKDYPRKPARIGSGNVK